MVWPITGAESYVGGIGKSMKREKWVMSSCLCKYGEGAGFSFQVRSLENGVEDAVHTFYVHKAHHGTSPSADFHEAASITSVVRSFRQRCWGNAKNDSNSGKSRSKLRTIGPYSRSQRARNLRNACSAWARRARRSAPAV